MQSDLDLYIGKEVTVTMDSGARYQGILHRWGKEKISLSKLRIVNYADGITSPKNKSTRKFSIDKIQSINLNA